MLVSDIYTDVIDALGRCNEATAFRRLTEAIAMLQNKARWNPNLGEIDLCVTQNYVTLPRVVGTVLGVLTNGKPNYLTDASWFNYHLNGPGDQECVSCNYAQIAGVFCTIRDPSAPVYMVTELESSADNNTQLRVFGTDASGNEIFTQNPTTGDMERGFLVPTTFGFSVRNANAPAIARVTRIQKSPTSGRIKLLAVNTDDLSAHTLIGYYEPDETEPQYQRLKVPPHSWVRVKYQKKDYVIRSQSDWISLNSSQAIIMAVKSVKFRYDDKNDIADQYEGIAARLLSEDQKATQPAVVLSPQIVNSDTFNQCQQDTLIYGGGGWG
jgi:hypothetical protein